MATAELNEGTVLETELDRVTAWRFEQLLQAGYDRPEAVALAQRGDVDLHRAEELLRAGCSPQLALEILR